MPPRLRAPILRRSFTNSSQVRAEENSSSVSAREDAQNLDFDVTVSKEWADRKDVKDMLQWLALEGSQYKRPKAAGGPSYVKARMGRTKQQSKDKVSAPTTSKHSKEPVDSSPVVNEAGYLKRIQDTKGFVSGKLERPFPLNPNYQSFPVLSEVAKEAIYRYVTVEKRSIKQASERFRVSIERVVAVVRLKEIERNLVQEGKRIVPRYSEQVMRMLPQTLYTPQKMTPHEGINDLKVHHWTTQQIFWPVSESRHFTREDAGHVFNENLKPADVRIPHPEIVLKQQTESNASRSMRMKLEDALREQDEEKKMNQKVEGNTKSLDRGRWTFKIEDVNIDATVGKTGRGRHGVGWRYGLPFDDRKRGIIKIPTNVP